MALNDHLMVTEMYLLFSQLNGDWKVTEWRLSVLTEWWCFVLWSPIWEGHGPSFEQTWIPFTQGYLVPILVEIGQVVLEKKMKMWKVYRQTDDRRLEKLTWAFSSGKLNNMWNFITCHTNEPNRYPNNSPIWYSIHSLWTRVYFADWELICQ